MVGAFGQRDGRALWHRHSFFQLFEPVQDDVDRLCSRRGRRDHQETRSVRRKVVLTSAARPEAQPAARSTVFPTVGRLSTLRVRPWCHLAGVGGCQREHRRSICQLVTIGTRVCHPTVDGSLLNWVPAMFRTSTSTNPPETRNRFVFRTYVVPEWSLRSLPSHTRRQPPAAGRGHNLAILVDHLAPPDRDNRPTGQLPTREE